MNKEKFNQVFPKSKINWEVIEPHLSKIKNVPEFLAQCGHESQGFTKFVENMNYSADRLKVVFKKYFPTDDLANQYARNPEKIGNRVYANRMGNGPESSGDGFKYRGRGCIHTTGKLNYGMCAETTGIDCLNHPELLETPEGAIISAVWYWTTNGLNNVSDFTTLTKRINGGTNGLAERQDLLAKLKS